MKNWIKYATLLLFIIVPFSGIKAQVLNDNQNIIDYSNPKEYYIHKIIISGNHHTDTNICKLLSGLNEGERILIPGEKTSKAVQNLWKQGIFDNIRIAAIPLGGDTLNLDIHLSEHPRLSEAPMFSSNVKKGDVDDLREMLDLGRGDFINNHVILKSKNAIEKFYVDKGFYNVEVNIKEILDTAQNKYLAKMQIEVIKHKKVKINKINFIGNNQIPGSTLKHKMKKTKEKSIIDPFRDIDKLLFQTVKKLVKPDTVSIVDNALAFFEDRLVIRLFKTAKFSEEEYQNDKQAILDKYNEMGFRDAQIVSDSIYRTGSHFLNIDMRISEGKKYYFRNIRWVGNTKYTSGQLSSILRINKGDVYNMKVLESNLNFNQNGLDVSSLYMDDGYLFFSATPVETNIVGDSIDLEIRIIEGKQAYINKVTVRGNTKTNDHVIIREIRSKPGQLFNRSDVIRTTRELAQLKYFDPEKITPDIQPNPNDGTVDIEYVVQETSSDQLELSGGWGMGRIIGTLGVSFNNFSTRNFFKKDAWRPLPSGDGQKLSIRAQSNGSYYQAYNASFTEPWLGGKKPIALSISGYYSVQTNGVKKGDATRQSIIISGASVGIGRQLKWPDDYFSAYAEVSYRNYQLDNYYSSFSYASGTSNNLNFTLSLSRSSTDAPIYPRSGSDLSLSLQFTPYYSIGSNKDYSSMEAAEKYKWIEYHKWKFNASWYIKVAGNLVLNTRTKFGFLGLYNRDIGIAPFERFYLGGDGLSGFALDGRELIGLRGYSNNSLTPKDGNTYIGGTIFNKYSLELRYPISLNPMATVFVLGFVEAGNAWDRFNSFNPFDVKRSAGLGVRIYLPMFGLLGLDWGYGFDEVPTEPGANKGQFHFSINQSID
jgi:outer membrane protein insertion porin family